MQLANIIKKMKCTLYLCLHSNPINKDCNMDKTLYTGNINNERIITIDLAKFSENTETLKRNKAVTP